MARTFWILGCVFAVMAVGAGAFGAHALRARLTPDLLAVWETAARYQMYHALALLVLAVAASRWPAAGWGAPGWLFTAGVVMWLPVLERLPAPEWFGTGAKLAYVFVVRLVETVLGNVFLWSGTVFYPVYADGDELWGISPERDQGLAGAVMMLEGSLVTIVALVWLFLRLAREGELRQELLERGLDPRERERALVAGDVARGYYTEAQAEGLFGPFR